MQTFICPSCQHEKSMSRASKRFRTGLRKSPDRCLDCEAQAQKNRRIEHANAINAKRRAAYPRHAKKQKDTMLQRKYGIGLNEWDAAFELQGKKCAICETDEPGGRGWQTDHDHKTGKFRAILCHHCNSMIGHAKESPEVILFAFRYLCKHGGGAEAFLRSHYNNSPAI